MRSPLPASLALLLVVALAAPALAQRTWQVPLDAPTIQAGLDSATSGDDYSSTSPSPVSRSTYFLNHARSHSILAWRMLQRPSPCPWSG